MADSKISTLTAATVAAATNELEINEAGTSKKLTGTLLKAFTDPNPIIAGATGAVTSVIGVNTLQVLTANNADIPTTTVVTQLTASSLGAGWWFAQYNILWQSNVTTTGITFIVDFTGTVTSILSQREDPLSGIGTALAATGISDSALATTVTGALASKWSTRTDAGALGPNAGVTTINVNQTTIITVWLLAGGAGDLLLRANSEVAATITRVAAGTNARYTRLS